VPDPLEAVGQDVLREAFHELQRRQHAPPQFIVVTPISPLKADLTVVQRQNPFVADRRAMRIA
jgi:hypothetical protein